MLDPDVPTGAPADDTAAAAAEPATPPRRRRAASRPAGPPKEIAAAPEPPAAPVLEAPRHGPELEPAAEPEALEKPKRAPRHRTKKAEAVEVVEAPADQTPADEAPAEQPLEEVAVEEAAADEAPVEEAVAPAEESPAVEDDPLRASLAQLTGQPRRPRLDDRLASPFGAATDVASALENLTAALKGAPAAADETDEDADADEAAVEAEPDLEADTPGQPGEGGDLDTDEDEAPEEADADDEAADAAEGEDDATSPRRRRRRRGGRRRRRGASEGEDADEATDEEEPADGEEAPADEGDGDAEDEASGEEGPAEGTSRRRRRRRRRGEDTGSTDDEGVDVVVKVREPRRARSASDEVTGIEGSTRMEAKRQRRREGRAAGRRRAPVLSEAEFLARRESVDRIMLIRQAEEYTQIGVLEDGVLVEHYVDRDSAASLIGNIYLGRVQNVLPSMEAAFIDIGRGRNAVLYAGEVDWDGFGVSGDDRKVERVLKSGQSVLVQVTKDPVGAKGARLTSHISIPGRYVVYSPGGQLSGISRKLPEGERQRLKGILDDLVGETASVIVRTAAEGASEEELVRDVNRLKAQWEIIEKKTKGSAPQQLYTEPDLTVRIVRDLFTEDFSRLVVDGNGHGEDAYDTVQAYVTHVAPHLQERLVHWNREADGDLFETFRVNEQVSKALERKVHLPSGGSLIIDRTEAMTVVDVNTGKFTGTQGNLEATVTSNNLEAAEELVRQLRLRDIGGIIVVDFIDMVLPANRELLLRRLVECLGRDRTRHQVAEVTSLGLVQMTRKKIGTGLAEAFTVPCETCQARGYHIHEAPVATQAPADGGDRDGAARRGRGGGRGNSRGRGGAQAEQQPASGEGQPVS